jgi:hypothetical protein
LPSRAVAELPGKRLRPKWEYPRAEAGFGVEKNRLLKYRLVPSKCPDDDAIASSWCQEDSWTLFED